jgi:hypothetical protein
MSQVHMHEILFLYGDGTVNGCMKM